MAYDDRTKLRRRIARTCFGLILVTFVFCGVFVLFGDRNSRENLEVVSGIIMAVLLFATSIIGGYMGTVAHSDYQDKKDARDK